MSSPRFLPLALTIALFTPGVFAGAQAGAISNPPAPSSLFYRTIASLEMTVSNSSGYANFRAKPTTSSRIIDRLPQGTKVTVIDQIPGSKWVHVKVGEREGYIEAKLLK
jgi:uncharacterized protein YgiM (DUF1202 family)